MFLVWCERVGRRGGVNAWMVGGWVNKVTKNNTGEKENEAEAGFDGRGLNLDK